MKIEELGYELNLVYSVGSLNPIDINEHSLTEIGIIDDQNSLNRSMIRIGSIGTNLVFSNATKDEIRVQQNGLKVESKDLARLVYIVDKLKSRFDNLTILSGKICLDVHLMDDSFPELVFKQYSKVEGLVMDAIQFRKDATFFTMYSCGKSKIHMRVINEIGFGKTFKEFNVEDDLSVKKLNECYTEFVEKDIKPLL